MKKIDTETKNVVEKLYSNSDFVKKEIDKILVYYNLKHTIRYNHSRDGVIQQTESVAEHIYGIHILCDYFLPLHKTDEMDSDIIRHLITWHDMGEAIVGDMTAELKTETHKIAELKAEDELTTSAPLHLQTDLQKYFHIYNKQETKEAQFVKALDKLEPLFHLVSLSRKKDFVAFKLRWTVEDDKNYRSKSIRKFSLLQRFDDVISLELDTLDYYA